MTRKPGRPPGAQNKVGKDEKEFLKGLLGDTQQQYRDAFMYYSKRAYENDDDRRFFMTLRNDVTRMIVPKPVEIDATIEASDFETILGICSKWDDQK